MKSGFSYTGTVVGVKSKTFPKKDGKGEFTRVSLVVMNDDFENEEFDLFESHIDKGWVEKLNAIKDKKVIFPCSVRMSGKYLNINLGDDFPEEVSPSVPVKTAQPKAVG